MIERPKVLCSAILTAWFLASCQQPIERPAFGGKSSENSGASRDPNSTALTCQSDSNLDPGVSPLRRLTRSQYINSVRSLLGDLPVLKNSLSTQVDASAFGNVPSNVGKSDVESYQTAAESIASAFVADKDKLNAVFDCEKSTAKRDCALAAIANVGKRAYRLPLTKDDTDALQSMYDLGAKMSHEHGIELMISMLLQNPRFLYQFEFGTTEKRGEKAVRLSPYEIATRLAFAVWDSIPDDKLLKAAANGDLATAEGVQKQLIWMMQDPKGKDLLVRFLNGWAQIDNLAAKAKDLTLYPEWKDDVLKNALRSQASAFFQDVVNNQGGTLSALLTSKTTMVNDVTAKIYGGSGDASFKAVESTDGNISGLLTLPAFLAINANPAESSPILRGRFVRERLLCQNLPSAPGGIPEAPKVTPGSSTRERLQQHEVNPTCGGCHKMMDPIGFGFENFDAIGRFRTMDGGKPVDASGEIFSAKGIEGKYNGVIELGEKLASSSEVQDCMIKTWFRFLVSRFEQSADACSLKKAGESFDAANADLRVLPSAIIGSDAFLYRQPIKN